MKAFALATLLSLLPIPAHALMVKVTAFVARGHEQTSFGTRPIPGYTVAVSRDLRHLVGRKIYIKGIGSRYVESVTHKRLRKTVDLLVSSLSEAKRFGRKDARVRVII